MTRRPIIPPAVRTTSTSVSYTHLNGIFPVDDKTIAYMKEHGSRPYTVYEADEDAVYEETYTIDLLSLIHSYYRIGDRHLVVSRGLGEHTVKIRIGNPPELVFLHLCPSGTT